MKITWNIKTVHWTCGDGCCSYSWINYNVFKWYSLVMESEKSRINNADTFLPLWLIVEVLGKCSGINTQEDSFKEKVCGYLCVEPKNDWFWHPDTHHRYDETIGLFKEFGMELEIYHEDTED